MTIIRRQSGIGVGVSNTYLYKSLKCRSARTLIVKSGETLKRQSSAVCKAVNGFTVGIAAGAV
jgi:hypothetical protein